MNPRIGIVVLAIVATACVEKPRPPAPNRILTTTEIASTGIVQHLADMFQAQTGVISITRAVAPAQVLDEVTHHNADAVIVDDLHLVKALQEHGAAKLVSAFANDDYLLVGPPDDPARVRKARTAADAFRRIYSRRIAFCSAVDVERFFSRETDIWKAAGLDPKKNRRYRECHGDAAATLRDAEHRRAYAITDRATFDAVRPDRLRTLLKGTPMLDRDLFVVLIENGVTRKNPEWFVQWLMSYRGRDSVESYRVGEVKPFYVER